MPGTWQLGLSGVLRGWLALPTQVELDSRAIGQVVWKSARDGCCLGWGLVGSHQSSSHGRHPCWLELAF